MMNLKMPLTSICHPYLPTCVVWLLWSIYMDYQSHWDAGLKSKKKKHPNINIPIHRCSTYREYAFTQPIPLECGRFFHPSYPIRSMYDIFTYTYQKQQLNVGKWTIHGSCGYTPEVLCHHFFWGWFPNHHYLSKGLSSTICLNGSWLPGYR